MVQVDPSSAEGDKYVQYPKVRAVGWCGTAMGEKALIRERKKGQNSIISS